MTTETSNIQTIDYPSFTQADKMHVVAINPDMGSVAMKSFNDGEYRDWNGEVKNDERYLMEYVEYYARMNYGVVVNAPRFNAEGKMRSNLVITIDPASINCDCGKGIYCPTNKQTVTYWNTEAM